MELTPELVGTAIASAGFGSSVFAAGTKHPSVDEALAHLKGL